MRKILIIAGLAVCLVLILTGIVTVAFRSSEPSNEDVAVLMLREQETAAPTEEETVAGESEPISEDWAEEATVPTESTAVPYQSQEPEYTEEQSHIPATNDAAEKSGATQDTPAESDPVTPTQPQQAPDDPGSAYSLKPETGEATEPTDTAASFQACDGGSLQYWLYTPSNPTANMPLIVYLHGGSGKGNDLNLLTSTDGFPKYLQSGLLGDVRAYVIMPQLPGAQKGWADAQDSLYRLIQNTVSQYGIDPGNISLTGHSMGGTGTWNLAAAYPSLFARIAPLSGSVRDAADTAAVLRNIPVWAFVGSADTIVPPESSEEVVDHLLESNADANITVFDGADHFTVPSLTYLDSEINLIGWLIGQTDHPHSDGNQASLFSARPYSAQEDSAILDDDLISITQWESDHPPLSEDIKKAVADYKKKPNSATEQALLDALNAAYDQIIQTKVNNRDGYIKTRTSRIKGWVDLVNDHQWPSFMLLNTDNNKAAERQVVSEAVNKYWENPTSANRETVRNALEAYYDAFLAEQDEIVRLTEEAREERITASFAYYTSDLFQIHQNVVISTTQEESLAEIICGYISVGAEIVYCNPEARVRERELNSAVYDSRSAYLANPNEETRSAYRTAIETAFQTAYEVRMEALGIAERKGLDGAAVLLDSLFDPDYIAEKYQELTEQHNLYGRIDRMVTYGNNTYATDWAPRMQSESRSLSKRLEEYWANPTAEAKQAVKTEFESIYTQMLSLEKQHLFQVASCMEGFVDKTFYELLGQSVPTESGDSTGDTVASTTPPVEESQDETQASETVPTGETRPFTPKKFEVSVGTEVSVGEMLTVSVTASTDVSSVMINGKAAKLTRQGNKLSTNTWQIQLPAKRVGELEVKVVALSETGEAASAVVRVVSVIAKNTSE